jgi:hypothetical protein
MNGTRHLPLAAWLRLLLDDGRILLSWVVLIGSGAYVLYSMSGHFGARPTPYLPSQIWQGSLSGAYWGWAMYWGVPGCLGFLNRGKNHVLRYGFSLATLVTLVIFCAFASVVIFSYPVMGGGVFHFLKRWRDAGRRFAAAQPPVVNVTVQSPVMQPTPMMQPPMTMQPGTIAPAAYTDVERRLMELADLLRRGLITQQEHDQQRSNILRSV